MLCGGPGFCGVLAGGVPQVSGCIACEAQRAIDEAVINSSNRNYRSGQEDCLGVCVQGEEV